MDTTHITDDAMIERVVARFAPESLGLRLTPGELRRAGREGLDAAREAGPNTGATLAAAAERAIRREVPTKHQGLAWRVAFRHRDRARAVGLDVEDLVSEGQFGLIRAAQLYDPDFGYRFNTYAWKWVSVYAQRAIEDEPGIARVPKHVRYQIAKARREHGRTYRDHLDANARAALDLQGRRLLRAVADSGSYASYLAIDLSRVVLDDHPEGREWERDELVAALLASLAGPHRVRVCDYYGLGRPARTLREIARETRSNRTTVRQRLDVSLAALRAEAERRGLDYGDCIAS